MGGWIHLLTGTAGSLQQAVRSRWKSWRRVSQRHVYSVPVLPAAKLHPHIVCAASMLVVALLVKLDTLGPLAGFDFTPKQHPIGRIHEVAATWPQDVGGSSLSKADIPFGSGNGNSAWGPESVEFDHDGVGPYTGVADGRVIRWKDGKWETFAIISPTWEVACTTNLTKKTERARLATEHKCGRPLGLRFDTHAGRDGQLYIADAYFGLHSVGAEGGQARLLTNEADGQPLKFTNDLDIHPNGSIFFTDSSTRWTRRQYFLSILEGEASGRLLRYDPGSKHTEVVLSGLNFPNGVAISQDASFLLVTETTNFRILRLWLKGPRTGTTEVFKDLMGYPDNIRRTSSGDFWVAMNGPRTWIHELCSRNPWTRSLLFLLPLPLRYTVRLYQPKPLKALAALVDRQGQVVRVLEDRNGTAVQTLSEVQERNGVLWMGSVVHHQIATLDLRHVWQD